MYIIAGLGNPGSKYEKTRHNMGFRVIDLLTEKYHIDMNMKKHKAVCGTGVIEGMKVMLWYSVPYIGVHSKAYQKFHDMLLDSSGKEWFCADPRFKEVRGFLTETYVNAVQSWGLDGLKLDFIDAFKLNGKSLEYDPRRDYTSLEDAIDALMNEVTAAN